MIKFLPLDKLNGRYSDEIRKALLSVVESGRYLTGSEVRGFELTIRNSRRPGTA
jgi:dTDP-4-amino-4,6-dideoxygalactose transaminase